MIKLRVLRWRDNPGSSGWPQCTHKDLGRGKKESQAEMRVMQAMSQPLGAGKHKETYFPLDSLEGMQAC